MTEKKDEKKAIKQKQPTPLKRNLQNQKRNLENRAFRARVRTAINAYKNAVSTGKAEEINLKLGEVYSLADKAVKTGRYKKNKANRIKTRLCALSVKK